MSAGGAAPADGPPGRPDPAPLAACATAAERPLVSVVTPSLNQGEYIAATIESVRQQDYPAIEHLVVDGGSTDDTLDVLRRYPHLQWTSAPDAGQADAVNQGWQRARGDILGWLNADDTYTPGAIAAAVAAFAAHPNVDLIYGDCHEIDAAGRRLGTARARPYDRGALLRLEYDIYQPAVFLRRRVLDRVGLLDARLHLAMDWDYWVRAGGCCRLLYVPRAWACFRVHAAAKMSARARAILPEHLHTLRRAFAEPALPRAIRRRRRETYSNAYLAGALRSYAAGERAEARARLTRALRWYPHPLRPKTLKALLLLVDTLSGRQAGREVVDWLRAARRRAPRPARS
jgi:glycosyltransferase involved in cell wall biosynthesis